MHLYSQRFLTEEISPDGGPKFRSFLSSVHRVYGEPAGVHPSGRMFAGLAPPGSTPHGVRSTSAVITESFYLGSYPLVLQPKLNKPDPWT
jgi:hypothetical protein